MSMALQRVQEAKKLGFDTVILPEACRQSVNQVTGVKLIFVSGIREAISAISK